MENITVTLSSSDGTSEIFDYKGEGGWTGAVTPYNPGSNFGNGVVGYFRALSSTIAEIVAN